MKRQPSNGAQSRGNRWEMPGGQYWLIRVLASATALRLNAGCWRNAVGGRPGQALCQQDREVGLRCRRLGTKSWNRERLAVVPVDERGGAKAVVRLEFPRKMGDAFEAKLKSDGLNAAMFLQELGRQAQPLLVQPILRAAPEKLVGVTAKLARGNLQCPGQNPCAKARLPGHGEQLSHVLNCRRDHANSNSFCGILRELNG